jgi:purine-nucleoside phosphorylase
LAQSRLRSAGVAANDDALSKDDVAMLALMPVETLSSEAREAARIVRRTIGEATIDLAIVLGTGLGGLAEAIENPVAFPYATLPGFPAGEGVTGHAKRLVIGRLEGRMVAMLQGRAHYYEQGDARVMLKPLETLLALGLDSVFLTNSAGGLREEWGAGAIAAIADHIAYSGVNPLIGMPGDRRFVPLNDAYDPGLRAILQAAAAEAKVRLPEGVYMWFSGPAFETPAEIRMAQRMGADLVGMSTVPETILARYLGLKVVATSTITNLGAGIGGAPAPSHTETKEVALRVAGDFERLMRAFLRRL